MCAEQARAADDEDEPFDGSEPEPREDPQETEFNREIRRVAALSAFAYSRERIPAAKRLQVKVSVLDKLVAAERKEGGTGSQGKPLELPEPEPWPEPVVGAALLDEIEAAIERYVVLPKDAAFTSALWVLHAHCFDAFTCTPRLATEASIG